MLSIPVFDAEGQPSGNVEIDPQVLGGRVRPKLLKQAIVMYQGNARQNSSTTRSRGMVVGSTRKLYRQKGTGNARMGARRTNLRRGGGVAFAKGGQVFKRALNKKMRRLARNNAILAKIERQNVMVVDELSFDAPSTRRLVSMVTAMGAEGGFVLALDRPDRTLHLSGRNIAGGEVRSLSDLNAYDVLRGKKLIMTRPALEALLAGPNRTRSEPAAAEG